MPIYKGSAKLGTIYHGGTKIEKVYKKRLAYTQYLRDFTLQDNWWTLDIKGME